MVFAPLAPLRCDAFDLPATWLPPGSVAKAPPRKPTNVSLTASKIARLEARHDLIPVLFYNGWVSKKHQRPDVSHSSKESLRHLETLNELLIDFFKERLDTATENCIELKSRFRTLCALRQDWPLPAADPRFGEAALVQTIKDNSERPAEVDELKAYISNFINSIHAPENSPLQPRRVAQSKKVYADSSDAQDRKDFNERLSDIEDEESSDDGSMDDDDDDEQESEPESEPVSTKREPRRSLGLSDGESDEGSESSFVPRFVGRAATVLTKHASRDDKQILSNRPVGTKAGLTKRMASIVAAAAAAAAAAASPKRATPPKRKAAAVEEPSDHSSAEESADEISSRSPTPAPVSKSKLGSARKNGRVEDEKLTNEAEQTRAQRVAVESVRQPSPVQRAAAESPAATTTPRPKVVVYRPRVSGAVGGSVPAAAASAPAVLPASLPASPPVVVQKGPTCDECDSIAESYLLDCSGPKPLCADHKAQSIADHAQFAGVLFLQQWRSVAEFAREQQEGKKKLREARDQLKQQLAAINATSENTSARKAEAAVLEEQRIRELKLKCTSTRDGTQATRSRLQQQIAALQQQMAALQKQDTALQQTEATQEQVIRQCDQQMQHHQNKKQRCATASDAPEVRTARSRLSDVIAERYTTGQRCTLAELQNATFLAVARQAEKALEEATIKYIEGMFE